MPIPRLAWVHRPAAVGSVAVGSSGRGATATLAAVADDKRGEALSYLAGVQQRLEREGVTVQNECSEGKASVVILRRARQLGVDLIAITTHGRTGVDRLLLGSVAEEVIRGAPCPVHLVRVHR